jgi:hypothetical protein
MAASALSSAGVSSLSFVGSSVRFPFSTAAISFSRGVLGYKESITSKKYNTNRGVLSHGESNTPKKHKTKNRGILSYRESNAPNIT